VDEATGRVHYMGTDNIGRDYFSRLIYAGRISLTVAILSVLISEFIGIIVGAISGFFGGWVDAVLMRFVEFMLTIPTLPLLLIISSMLLRNDE
jgi:peptide/nickel transport system permease protein